MLQFCSDGFRNNSLWACGEKWLWNEYWQRTASYGGSAEERGRFYYWSWKECLYCWYLDKKRSTFTISDRTAVLEETRVISKLFALRLVLGLNHGNLIEVVLWVLI